VIDFFSEENKLDIKYTSAKITKRQERDQESYFWFVSSKYPVSVAALICRTKDF